MDSYPTTDLPGSIAPADGNVSPLGQARPLVGAQHKNATGGTDNDADGFDWMEGAQRKSDGRVDDTGTNTAAADLGPNNERLADFKPKLVNALRELVRQYREEGIAAR